jgi:hypothetical protein
MVFEGLQILACAQGVLFGTGIWVFLFLPTMHTAPSSCGDVLQVGIAGRLQQSWQFDASL